MRCSLLALVCRASAQTIFFSEYAEGLSHNKYLEIYNPTSATIQLHECNTRANDTHTLSNFAIFSSNRNSIRCTLTDAFPSVSNAPGTVGFYDHWNSFTAGASIKPGEVYVICHPSADAHITSRCDQTHTILSNGDDGYCLAKGKSGAGHYVLVDCIGDFNGDPGRGWSVCGVTTATRDHTLVRNASVTTGTADWTASAGTSTANCQWIVMPRHTWTHLGSHSMNFFPVDVPTLEVRVP